jgi:hypothetical protein
MGDARRRKQMGLMPAPTLPFFEDVPAEYRASVSAIPATLAMELYCTIDGEQFDLSQVLRDTAFLPEECRLDTRVSMLFNPPWDNRFDRLLCDHEKLSLMPPDGEVWQEEFRKATVLKWASEVIGNLLWRMSGDEAFSKKFNDALDFEAPIISLGDLIKLLEVTP